MMKLRKLIPIIIASYIFVIAINLIGNYQYYAAGNDWRHSIFFILGLTSFCWAAFSLLGYLVFSRLKWHDKPTLRILTASFLYGIFGAIVTTVAMKAMVLFLHFQEYSTSDYISTCIFSALFSMVIGLMVTAQQTLIHLKKSIEDNEHLKQEMIQSKYETLKNQVNPHFLFNSLNTLTVMIHQQPDTAVQFVEQMSKVFRYSLQHSNENTIDLGTELKVVQSYLFLNQQRYDGKLIYHIRIDDEQMQKKVITQSLLMLVENAVKHNELSYENPLNIDIYTEGRYLLVENPLQPKSLIERSTKVGLENIKKRYHLVSEYPVIVENNNKLFTVKIPLL
jgi:sensor histidine kinase YesM